MKKTFIIMAVLVVAMILGATGYSSIKTEKVFRSQAIRMGELYGPMLGISLDTYDRGYFRSRARTSMQIGKSKRLHMLHTLTHLPWGSKVVTIVDQEAYTPEDLAAIRELVPLEQLKIVCHFAMTGSSDAKMEIPAMVMEQDGVKIHFTGIGLTGGLNSAMDRGDFDFRIEALQVQTSDDKECSIEGFRYSGTYREVEGLPLGEGVLQLDALQAKRGENISHVLKNGICRFNSTLTDKTFNEYVDITFDNMAVLDASYSNGQLKFDISGMDADSIRALRDVYRASSVDVLNGEDVDPFVMQLQVMSRSMQLLQKGMHFRLEALKAESANGAMRAAGFVDLKKMPEGAAPSFDLKSIDAQVKLHFDGEGFADGYRMVSALQGNHNPGEDLSHQVETLSTSLLAQGVLVQDGDVGLMVEFSLADGKASLNGEPLSR